MSPLVAENIEKRSTGIDILDQILGGGIPAGSVICLFANPLSMAEIFMYQFASTRKTYYMSTARRPEYVQRNMQSLNFDTSSMEFINLYTKFNIREEGLNVRFPTMKRNMYDLSQHTAKRVTKLFAKTANIPEDLLWKFDFWTEEKAIKVLGGLSEKIYGTLMAADDASVPHILSANPKEMHFTFELDECGECKDVSGSKEELCHFHAGAFSGMLSSLLNAELDSYESNCHGVDSDQKCKFVVGKGDDPDMNKNVSEFLEPAFENPIEEANMFIEHELKNIESAAADGNFNIIVDTFSFFIDMAKDIDGVRNMLNLIYDTTLKANGTTMIYMLRNAHPKDVENLVINTCDAVFNVETEEIGDNIETILSIPKIRGMAAPAKRIKVKIEERVFVDTSRAIA